jgi:hypothetical protein
MVDWMPWECKNRNIFFKGTKEPADDASIGLMNLTFPKPAQKVKGHS